MYTEPSTGAWPAGCTRCGRYIGDGYRNTWGWCLRCEEAARSRIGKPTPDAVAYSLKLLSPAEREAVIRQAAKTAGLRVLTEEQADLLVKPAQDWYGGHLTAEKLLSPDAKAVHAENVRWLAQRTWELLAALGGDGGA